MDYRKPSVVTLLTVLLTVVGGSLLLDRATPLSASVQPTPVRHARQDARHPTWRDTALDIAPDAGLAPLAAGDPASIEIDKDGYTVWTYDYSDEAWCVMYSRIRWPFDLGGQDPTQLSETVLKLTFAEQEYVIGPEGEQVYKDTTWSVALNGDPPDEWNVIGTISAEPTRGYKAPVTQEIPFSYKELIDGENNLWFQQHDNCNCSALPDCACTCYELYTLQLRAMVKLGIKSVSPAPDAQNVRVDQRRNPEIRVAFTTLVDPDSINNLYRV